MAVEAYVDGSPVIVANVLGSDPAAAQNSGATYIKGDPGPPGPPGPEGPAGQDGQNGSDGQDGFSPTITSTSITGGHRLIITDVDSTKTVDVMDGQDGQDGQAGQDGQDGTPAGFGTPSATVDSGTGTPGVTVTASGPDTAKVFAFAFSNLKGDKGDTGETGPQGPAGPQVDPATATPLVDGTAAVGTSDKYAREDHVHPTDTSRAKANAVLQAAVQTVSANGTSASITLTGLTADHVVGNWGMFTDSGCTTPIPENAPTCDLEITTGADSWTYTVANFTSTFYLRPTFIKD